MGCGGHLHQAETKIWEFLVSKGDAEHRSVEFHQRDKMADISLGYETEWHSMSVQLVSENLNFLLSLLTSTLSRKLLLCWRNATEITRFSIGAAFNSRLESHVNV